MKIQVVTGATIYESARNTLKGIDVKDVFTPYFVVVPDRFTLQAEKMLFEVLGIRSTFNINVVGLSSLAGKVIKEAGYEELSALDGVLLVQKAMMELKGVLQYFTRCNPALCQEIYKTIQQMKSSKISWQSIKEKTKSSNLTKKIADIKAIYERYESLRAGRIDSDDVIELFANKIREQGLYKDSVFLFVGFDSFTTTNYEVISALTTTVKEVRFAVSKPLSPSNAFIYEGDILNKLKRLALACEVSIEVVSPATEETTERVHLMSNLFGRQIEPKQHSGYVYIASSPSLKEEVLFVAKAIKKAVFDGARFKDFSIICPTLEEYKQEIEICFPKFGITSYIDTSSLFSETSLARFLSKCFSIVAKGFVKEDILYFLSSRFLDIEGREELIAFVNEKNISGRERFSYFIAKDNPVLSLISLLKETATFEEYALFIEQITEIVKGKVLEFASQEIQRGLVQEASFDTQSLDAVKEVVASFKSFKAETNLKDFSAMLLTALDSKEISSLPSFCDQVFVGDSTKSFFSKSKYIFVLGANAGKLPQNSNDDGLLSDAEIEGSCFKQILEPTIKMVNKRNRFKLFSALCEAEERLVVSYLNFNEEGQKQEKAYFVNSVMSAFGISNKAVMQTNNLAIKDVDGLLFASGTLDEAKKQISLLSEQKNEFVGSVRMATGHDDERFRINREKLSEPYAEKLFFKGENAKVTQIEKFYDCPFKQFVDNGLKPVEKKYAEVKPNTYGTIMHSVLEDFVKEHALRMQTILDAEIHKFLNDNLESYLDEKIVDFLPDKELFLREVHSNAFKLCKRAVYESQNSMFVPTYFERRFDGRSLRLAGLNIVGCVDRVDIYDDSFRVVDYKTGKITAALLSSLYYGKKLQLFLYGNSLRKQLGLDFSGAFYFDAKISYAKNEKTILKGVFKPQEKIMFALDKRLADPEYKSSDLVKIDKTLKGYSKATLSQPDIVRLEEYALAITEKALAQMKGGFVRPCPSADSCTYCPYRSICLYEVDAGFRATKSAESFFKDKEEEE